MCSLRGTNWDLISQKTAFFIVTVKTSNLIICCLLQGLRVSQERNHYEAMKRTALKTQIWLVLVCINEWDIKIIFMAWWFPMYTHAVSLQLTFACSFWIFYFKSLLCVITITDLNIIHRLVIYIKHDVSEAGFCLRLKVVPTHLGPIGRAKSGNILVLCIGTYWVGHTWRRRQSSLRNVMF
jgi:hypothetical protein